MLNEPTLAARNREQFLDAATGAFIDQGYRVGVDRIAARAGVVKQTLYNHFDSKDVLFAEVVARMTAQILVSLDRAAGELRGTLVAFGTSLRRAALGPRGVAIFRTLVAEAPRFPGVARAAYAEGPARTQAQLAAFLEQAMDEHRLRREDPRFAAAMLIGMLLGQDRTRQLFTLEKPSLRKEATEHVVDCFLRAFSPDR